MGFLPDGYELPTEEGNYMKFKDGENKIRILSEPILGWLDWDDNRKPHRTALDQKPSRSQSTKKDAKIKHFWAMLVWNYQEHRIQILEITQSGIQKSINTFVADPDYGSPFDYDIVIKKTGESLETEYQVMPKPPKEVDPLISMEYNPKNYDLTALYRNENPFLS